MGLEVTENDDERWKVTFLGEWWKASATGRRQRRPHRMSSRVSGDAFDGGEFSR
jgi:hypothetical protein